MPLVLPKENANQEEINAWIIDTQEKYNKMEIDLEQKTKREKELLNENNRLYSKITGQKEDKKEDKKEDDYKIDCMSKDMYDNLGVTLQNELNDILENEEVED